MTGMDAGVKKHDTADPTTGSKLKGVTDQPKEKCMNEAKYKEENTTLLISFYFVTFKKGKVRDAWVAQSVKHLPLAQVMISGSWDQALSPATLLSRESVSPSPLSHCPSPRSCMHSLSFFLSQINK